MIALLELRGVHAGYAGTPVVRDLDLAVHSGEIVALLGANGAGKTTTLRTISHLLPAISGEMLFDGRSFRGVAADRLSSLGISHVPEDRAVFRSLTVRENLRLGRRGSRLDEVTGRFPALAPLLDRRVGLLSGGEQQMLAVGRALVGDVRLLLVDEMSLGLGPMIVDTIASALREAADRRGVGVILVEQHARVALGISDRAYVLSHGHVVLSGTSSALLQDPDLLAASYLGESRKV